MPAEKVPSWIRQFLMPELNEIKGELKAINARIDSTNERINALESKMDIKIDSLRKEMLSKFEIVDGKFAGIDMKIETLNKVVTIKFDSLEQRIPVIEKITALELKIADIEKRLAAA